jgi:hypothetical protein
MAVIGFGTVAWVAKGDHHSARLEAARWAKDNLQRDTVIGLRDAGVFGYFSETKTVNLDGLINSYEFQDSILSGELESYMYKNDFAYLADAYVPCDYTSHAIFVRAYRGRFFRPFIGYRLDLSKDAEVYLGAPGQGQMGRYDSAICFGIWRFRGTPFSPIS